MKNKYYVYKDPKDRIISNILYWKICGDHVIFSLKNGRVGVNNYTPQEIINSSDKKEVSSSELALML